MSSMHDETSSFLMQQASGTSMNPAAAPMEMKMWMRGEWMLMLHGSAFVNQVWQSGPRGGDRLFSTNWIMGMADRPLGGGHLMLRSMLSLEPATVRHKQYPELFQTGETAFGQPIRDAQHPHDFFMEVAAEYAHPLGDAIGYVYAAPMGDPALGPVAFPHRASAMEIPQATLSHHVQDSTHVAANVVTLGVKRGMFGIEGSGFHGGEPDEDRWDIESGSIDSWALRGTFEPSPNWMLQLSTGHLKKPEALEDGDVQRTTASAAYARDLDDSQSIAASLVWGHNEKDEGRSGDGWLAEGVWKFGGVNYLTARAEIVDKDELFAGDENVPASITEESFRIKALTVGYSRDVWSGKGVVAGVGGNATFYQKPSELDPYYGTSPHSFYLFVRLRSAGSSEHDMP